MNSKNSKSLLDTRISENAGVEIEPTWTGFLYTVSPILIKALFSKPTRELTISLLSRLKPKRSLEKFKPSRADKKLRKKIVKQHGLKSLSQKEFDAFQIKNGYRVCLSGYDYSEIKPGNIPCMFVHEKGRASFLGSGKKWPNNSSIGKGSILGYNTITGAGSTLYKCQVMSGSIIGESNNLHDMVLADHITISSGTTALGSLVIGNDCLIKDDVTFKVSNILPGNEQNKTPKETGVPRIDYTIGDRLSVGRNFKLVGGKSSIGKDCLVLEGGQIEKSTFDSGLKCHGTTLNECIIQANEELHPGMFNCELHGCNVLGKPEHRTMIPKNSKLTNTIVGQYVSIPSHVHINQCELNNLNRIASHCILEGVVIKNTEGRRTFVDGVGTILKNCNVDGIDSRELNAADSQFINSRLEDCKFTGEKTSFSKTNFHGVNVLKGAFNLDKTCANEGLIKVYKVTFEGTINVSAFGKVNYYNCSFKPDEKGVLEFVQQNDQKLNSCVLDGVEKIVGIKDQVKLNNTKFEGSFEAPKNKPSTDNEVVNDPLSGQNPGPDFDYDFDHSQDDVAEMNEAQQEYYNNLQKNRPQIAEGNKPKNIGQSTLISPPIDEREEAEIQSESRFVVGPK